MDVVASCRRAASKRMAKTMAKGPRGNLVMTSVMPMALAETIEESLEKYREKLGTWKKSAPETFESKWFWMDFHISH